MNIKKIVLLLGVGVLLLITLIVIIQDKFTESCVYITKEPTSRELWDFNDGNGPIYIYTDGESIEWCEPLALSLIPFLPLLLLSLITYKMREEVFRAWWNFARWFAPVIIVVTFLLSNARGGGTLGMNKDFAILVLGLLYTIFIITSLVKIVRAFLKLRWEERGISGPQLKEIQKRTNLQIIGTVVFLLVAWFIIGSLM